MLLAVTEKCAKLDTRPALQRVLLAGLKGWLTSRNNSFILESRNFDIKMEKPISHQNQIRWNQLFLGRFCWQWSDLQDT